MLFAKFLDGLIDLIKFSAIFYTPFGLKELLLFLVILDS